MSNLERAVAVLEMKGIQAKIENGVVYVIIKDCELELAEFEIEFQSSEYDELNS